MTEKYLFKTDESNQNTSHTMVLDKESLHKRFMGDTELVDEILEIFLQDTLEQIAAIKKALLDKDIPLAKGHAHKLKGSCVTVSAIAMRDVVMQLEKSIEKENLKDTEKKITEVEEAFEKVRYEIKKTG